MSVSVLFICSQNTCRSAAADAVFSYVVRETGVDIAVDSAGISAEDGLPPSENIQQAGRLRGYDLSNLRSRLFTRSDFLHFDHLLVMDKSCLDLLRHNSPAGQVQKIELLMKYANFFEEQEILYPRENDLSAFSELFDYIEDACLGLFHHICDTSVRK